MMCEGSTIKYHVHFIKTFITICSTFSRAHDDAKEHVRLAAVLHGTNDLHLLINTLPGRHDSSARTSLFLLRLGNSFGSFYHSESFGGSNHSWCSFGGFNRSWCSFGGFNHSKSFGGCNRSKSFGGLIILR